MNSIAVTLPDTMAKFVEKLVAEGIAPSVEAYLQGLIREDQKRRAREQVEAQLVAGLESGPPTPMTSTDWENLRRRVRERLEQEKIHAAHGAENTGS